MNIWNDYTTSIYYMSVCQFFYELFFTSNLYIGNVTSPIGATVFIIQQIANLSSYLISNVLIFTIYYLLQYRAAFDTKKYNNAIISYVVAPNIVWAAIVAAALADGSDPLDEHSYFYIGLEVADIFFIISSVINVIMLIICARIVYVLLYNKVTKPTPNDLAIVKLVDQMKWYPLLQLISKVGPIYYELRYPSSNDVRYADSYDDRKYIALLFAKILPVVSPVGFLIIFLRMQSKALNHLRRKIDICLGHEKQDLPRGSSGTMESKGGASSVEMKNSFGSATTATTKDLEIVNQMHEGANAQAEAADVDSDEEREYISMDINAVRDTSVDRPEGDLEFDDCRQSLDVYRQHTHPSRINSFTGNRRI